MYIHHKHTHRTKQNRIEQKTNQTKSNQNKTTTEPSPSHLSPKERKKGLDKHSQTFVSCTAELVGVQITKQHSFDCLLQACKQQQSKNKYHHNFYIDCCSQQAKLKGSQLTMWPIKMIPGSTGGEIQGRCISSTYVFHQKKQSCFKQQISWQMLLLAREQVLTWSINAVVKKR